MPANRYLVQETAQSPVREQMLLVTGRSTQQARHRRSSEGHQDGSVEHSFHGPARMHLQHVCLHGQVESCGVALQAMAACCFLQYSLSCPQHTAVSLMMCKCTTTMTPAAIMDRSTCCCCCAFQVAKPSACVNNESQPCVIGSSVHAQYADASKARRAARAVTVVISPAARAPCWHLNLAVKADVTL